jgi:hypothetical protein
MEVEEEEGISLVIGIIIQSASVSWLACRRGGTEEGV